MTTPTTAFFAETARRLAWALLLAAFYTSSNAQSHIPVFPGLTGDELLEEVVGEYKPLTVLDYGDARDYMYGTLYRVNDSVSCVYSGHTLFLPDGVDPSTFLYMSGSPDGINAEHTYPRSKGADENDGNAFSDMHHLFPTRTAVNSARSNFPFGKIDDSQTTSWYYLNQTQSEIPSSNIDAYSERINGMFEPRESHKGNVARAVFYFFTMYKDAALAADPAFFESQRAALCEWHSQDPVDLAEWERTFMIAAYQDNSPNPFVLDCTLAYRSYCQGFPSDCEVGTVVEETAPLPVQLYPNPVIDRLHIVSEGEHSLQLADMLGRVYVEKVFSDATTLSLSFLSPGTYIVLVGGKAFRVVKL